MTAVSAAVERKLIEFAPDDISEINLARWYRSRTGKKTKRIELYQHQEKAIHSWVNGGMRGILAMATGTGKTFTALGCVEEARRKQERLVVVIVCPKNHLVQQWQREAEKFGIDFPKLVADSTNPTWKHKLTDKLIDISLGYENNLMILTTYATFPSESFRNIMREQKSNSCYLLIADEVHWLGAEKGREGLGDEYELRLGLSATPKRWMDIAGTKAIYDYFGEDVYEFPLEEAIYTINPTTGWSYLVHYRYVPKFVSLTNTEVQKYYESSKKISKMFHGSERGDEEDQILRNMLYKRADIVKDAEEKYKVLEQLMDELGSDIRWTIIYCTPRQMDRTMDIVYHAGITMRHSFTMNEGIKPEKKYAGLSERDDILQKFANGDYRVLVAMKCLDEGVDVPPARIAILMASSGNPREHIQRIGRVLRRYPEKEEATIYDIIVKPSSNLPRELSYYENKIFKKELDRSVEIARTAINNAEALEALYSVAH